MRRPSQTMIVVGLLVAYASACNLPQGQVSEAPSYPGEAATDLPAVATPIRTPSPTADLPVEVQICPGSGQVVALLVDPALYAGIRTGLARLEGDLCTDGYGVIQRRSDFPAPPDLRSYLVQLYDGTKQRLIGAILIGNFPHAHQWVTSRSANPKFPSVSEEVISLQFYSDLDGEFAASPDYQSTSKSPYSYDQHTGEVDWEIWIGVLPYYKGDVSLTVDALQRYFAKNHDYRTGGYALPRAFLEVSEHFKPATRSESDQILAGLRRGQYAWTPFSDAANARLYFDSSFANLSVTQGYADLSAGAADFVVVDTHGDWTSSGMLNIAWVESQPVRTVFFWSNGCAVGNLDHPDNFLTSMLYSPTSTVLVAKGTTNDSGGMGTNREGFFGHNIATTLSRGDSFGQAILDHVNVPLIYPWSESREFHVGTAVILGDPTLGLR